MIKINKTKPPKELEILKKEAVAEKWSVKYAYDKFCNPLKEWVRQSLVTEQGHLCAYCMRKIPDERVTDEKSPRIYIEHWIARNSLDSSDVALVLDYNNMLAVCSGNQFDKSVNGRRRLTCDAKRDDSLLKINPLDDSTLTTIYYKADGIISSTDEEIENDLDIKLNLNCEVDAVSLPKNRKNVLITFQEELCQYNEEEMIARCKEWLFELENEKDPKTPYVGIIIWYLNDMIQKLSS